MIYIYPTSCMWFFGKKSCINPCSIFSQPQTLLGTSKCQEGVLLFPKEKTKSPWTCVLHSGKSVTTCFPSSRDRALDSTLSPCPQSVLHTCCIDLSFHSLVHFMASSKLPRASGPSVGIDLCTRPPSPSLAVQQLFEEVLNESGLGWAWESNHTFSSPQPGAALSGNLQFDGTDWPAVSYHMDNPPTCTGSLCRAQDSGYQLLYCPPSCAPQSPGLEFLVSGPLYPVEILSLRF